MRAAGVGVAVADAKHPGSSDGIARRAEMSRLALFMQRDHSILLCKWSRFAMRFSTKMDELTSLRSGLVQPDGPANGSQPIRSETNRTSSAAGSRR